MTARDLDRAIAGLAQAQAGVFSRLQALELGFNDGQILRRLRSGAWTREGPGVYGLPGTWNSRRKRQWVDHLLVGRDSWVSHEAAAAEHGLTSFPHGAVVLTVPHGSHPRREFVDATVHETRDVMQPGWVTRIGGLPVSSVARAIVEVAAVVRTARLRAAVADAIAERKTSPAAIGRVLAAVARPGKPGIVRLAKVLDEYQKGRIPAKSTLERWLYKVLLAANEPRPRRQYPFPGRQMVEGCVDFAYPEAKLIIEVDGRRWHSRIDDLRRDHLRDAEAARAGWLVLRIGYEDLRDMPDEVVAIIRETRLVRTPAAA